MSLAIVKAFFVDEYAVDVDITGHSKLREDLWLDELGMQDLAAHIGKRCPAVRITPTQWDTLRTVADVQLIMDAVTVAHTAVPPVNADTAKLILTPVVDKQKTARQLAPTALPMLCFYHAGGAVAQMRAQAKQIDDASGAFAVNPIWCELPGRGVRSKDVLTESVHDTTVEFAATIATHVLGNDRAKPFLVFGHSCGTLHAFEVTRELQKMGFIASALIVINRQAPQIPMDKPEDVFPSDPEGFVAKMGKEYGQKTLLDMWKTSREVVIRSLPPSISDMKILTSYRLREPELKIRAPIICATSSADRPSNCEANCRPWKDVSTHPSFHFKVLPGGHFAYQDDSKSFWTWVFEQYASILKEAK